MARCQAASVLAMDLIFCVCLATAACMVVQDAPPTITCASVGYACSNGGTLRPDVVLATAGEANDAVCCVSALLLDHQPCLLHQKLQYISLQQPFQPSQARSPAACMARCQAASVLAMDLIFCVCLATAAFMFDICAGCPSTSHLWQRWLCLQQWRHPQA
jgi:hypothetical protein